MRRALFVFVAIVLVGCGGASVATPTIAVSPTANTAATATRNAELGQLATQQSESVQIATLSAALAQPPATVIPTPTALPPPNTSVPTSMPPTPTDTPVVPTDAPAPATSTAVPALPAGAQFVRGLDNDPVNIRERPSIQAPVVALLNPGVDALIAGPSSTDEQGQRWLWVRLGVSGKDGYVRADLVSAPHTVGSLPQAVVASNTPYASTGPLREPIPGKQSKDYNGADWLKLAKGDKDVLVLLDTVKVPGCYADVNRTILIIDQYLANHPEGRTANADILIYAALQTQGCIVPRALIAGQ